ncbi:hypothetical protein [Dyadobacter sp. LHD-138]|uniref:hypothetical protein n=1 Tax=Dyadobacter sp. LHD-138 TaxID=3071413 RepID=UPI0027E03DC6|nr:hypothetical protein [Dyadobacter sp. LHD-138]MDQ6482233.1 hypothetical protein [Dyadobacter sp. LHD-138]
MHTSYKRTFEFRSAAVNYLSTEKDETKLKSALEDVLEQIPDIQENFEKFSKRIKRKHAAEDRHGCILREENGGYKFTKDGEEKAEDELEEMMEDRTHVEIDPVLVDIPQDFPRSLLRYFKGFVFEQTEPEATPAQLLKSKVKSLNQK